MSNSRARHLWFALAMLLTYPASSGAWEVLNDASSLSFTATQQGASFTGRFDTFSAEVSFDADDPSAGAITGIVAIDSVDTEYAERDDYLRGSDWFDIGRWPEARFVTEEIIATDKPGEFTANALLTLRDQTRPVQMKFTFAKSANDDTWALTGEVALRRLEFGVGQGLWTNTEWVGDAVTINLTLVMKENTDTPPS